MSTSHVDALRRLLCTFLIVLPCWCVAGTLTYDFTGNIISRTYLPDEQPTGGVPQAPIPLYGAITLDVKHAADHDPEADIAVYRGVIKTIELDIQSSWVRMRYLRGVDGRNELRLYRSASDGYEEIRATARDVFGETGAPGLELVLVARTANRSVLSSLSPDVPFTSIPPELWELTITAPPSERTGNVQVRAVARLNAIRLRAPNEGGKDFYANGDFPPQTNAPPGSNWTHEQGAWEVRTEPCCKEPRQYFANTTVNSSTVALFIGQFPIRPDDGSERAHVSLVRTNYTLDAHLKSRWNARGNTLGLVYNYSDPNNYYELRLSPTGTATASKVVQGKRSVVASASFLRAPVAACKTWRKDETASSKSMSPYQSRKECPPGVDAAIHVVRRNETTMIAVNGKPVFTRLHQPELSEGQLGVFSSWNLIQLRNFSVKLYEPRLFPPEAPPSFTLGKAYFVSAFDLLGWIVHRGTWGIDRTTLSYANTQSEAHALTTFPDDPTPFGTVGIPENYTVDTNAHAEFTDPDSSIGIVFEFVSPAEYYEFTLAQDGTATLWEVIEGVRRVVAASRWEGERDIWLQLGVIRFEGKTSIEVNGERVFTEIPQASRAQRRAGLSSHLSVSAFNRFFIYWNEG